MAEHAVNLLGGRASGGQRRQLVVRKKGCLGGLDAGRRVAADELANEEQLVDGVEMVRPIALAEVVHRRKLDGTRFEARLLEHLPHHGLGRSLVHLGPAARRQARIGGAEAHEPSLASRTRSTRPSTNAAARTSTFGVA